MAVVKLGYTKWLSNNGSVLDKGKKAHIVGRIRIDVLMIDVIGISLDLFDGVVIFGHSPDTY
ncbi:alanine racemase C-terminal domain-containing protein [Acholeplasma laidlawii]|uniref:alanine racemase C-terminal domain-containing protein n=1 Tax=Acholeplasma laidlawii TaxID=2148 RepID=UPI00384D4811